MEKLIAVNKIRNLTLAGLIILATVVVSCSKNDELAPENEPLNGMHDIASILEKSTELPELFNDNDEFFKHRSYGKKKVPTFRNLTFALIKTNLLSTVAKNQLTVFAPTDEAFEMLFKSLGVKGIRDLSAAQLRPILLYHVVSGRVYSRNLSEGFVPTLNGSAVKVSLSGGVMINDAKVIYADIRALNGVIHVIDKVLLPPTQNLVEIAQGNPAFSILVEAVIKAGLAGTLATGGPFTVFAPTNDAFISLLGELGATSLDDIPLDLLTKVLLYHVVSGRVYSSDLPSGPLTVSTLSGESFSINASTLKITDANSREANLVPSLLDIQGTNGVIHVIDRVILPSLGS